MVTNSRGHDGYDFARLRFRAVCSLDPTFATILVFASVSTSQEDLDHCHVGSGLLLNRCSRDRYLDELRGPLDHRCRKRQQNMQIRNGTHYTTSQPITSYPFQGSTAVTALEITSCRPQAPCGSFFILVNNNLKRFEKYISDLLPTCSRDVEASSELLSRSDVSVL